MATRRAVSDILQSTAFKDDDLKPLFEGRLSFGTAGLRAPFGPGYNCMNDLTVTQTAQGLLKYLEESGTGVKERGIVVGYDHRASKDFTPYDLSSENFAKITAAVFESQGIPVYLYGGLVATPLVPFGVERVGAACGVMVTASHNPKEDTGYKVYWGNGAQIISPHDEGIAGKILENLEPWGEYDLGGVSTWEAGVAERRSGEGWRLFSGNEIGWVLGHWMWKKAVREGTEGAGGAEGGKIAMLASTVSSKFLGAVAKKEGFLFEETLTGFKWMGNRSEELRAEGYNVVFAY
ncbi:hypothetical protein TrRE_jg6936, partial [Triparma retinervis]